MARPKHYIRTGRCSVCGGEPVRLLVNKPICFSKSDCLRRWQTWVRKEFP